MINKQLRIMLVCGSGIASSSMIMPQVEKLLDELHYNYKIIKGSFKEIKDTPNLDLVLATMLTMPTYVQELGIPTVCVAKLFRGEKEPIKLEIKKALHDEG